MFNSTRVEGWRTHREYVHPYWAVGSLVVGLLVDAPISATGFFGGFVCGVIFPGIHERRSEKDLERG
jgi:hypothetical protein